MEEVLGAGHRFGKIVIISTLKHNKKYGLKPMGGSTEN